LYNPLLPIIPGVTPPDRRAAPGFVLRAPAAAIAAPLSPKAAAPALAPRAEFELAMTSAAMSFHTAAIENLQSVVKAAPGHAPAWRKLAELLRLGGNDAEAALALATAVRLGPDAVAWPPAVVERSPTKCAKAERKLEQMLRDVPEAEEGRVLRDHLFIHPTDVVAMRLLSRVEWRQEDGVTAHSLLERALDLAPDYMSARVDFARLLLERKFIARAVVATGHLLAGAPRDPELRALRADALMKIGDYRRALTVLEAMIADQPRAPHCWASYGACLRHVGRRDDSVQAYRTCLRIDPGFGQAYSGLADLKGHHLTALDVATMRTHLAGGGLDDSNRMMMSYALGTALERAGQYGESFTAYTEGAAAFRKVHANTKDAHNADDATDRIRRVKRVFTAPVLAARRAAEKPAGARDTPIFVVGMPRAGSTLVEQILASHSLVEGTRELPVMNEITRELGLRRLLLTPHAYPEHVLELDGDELAALGARFIEGARAYRQTDLPYFIDKRPWNWLDAGLIAMILPQAKIIDIRREPMAACFAMFKQLLPKDAAFSYDLTALGRYYNEYVHLMAHWDAVMPGRIHTVSYEALVADTETQVRGMLAYCGLPFEAGCLRFWETQRAVSTPSAEQVRRPIFKDAVEQWRKFEPWLGALKAALAAPLTL
jgi:tetratricopeptide (TPR) repeat protein